MSPTGVLAPRVDELRAPGSAVAPAPEATFTARGLPLGPRLRPEVWKQRPALSRCWVRWEEVGGRAPRGGGRERGRVQRRAARLRGGEKGAKGTGEPGGPELLLLLPRLPATRPGGRLSRLRRESRIQPALASRLLPAALPPVPPGRSAPGARTRTSCHPPTTPRSLFPARLLPPRRRRLRFLLPASRLSSSEPPAAEGAAAPSCACGRGARLLIPAGGGCASRAGGGRLRSEPSKVARGGGEGGAGGVGGERAQGRHGRLDARPSATGAGRSGAKRAVALSPPRAPAKRPQSCARAGPAASETREREVKAVAPLPGPGPAPRRGEQGRRAAGAAGTAGEPQPPPAFGP